jgi:hypothetical protein
MFPLPCPFQGVSTGNPKTFSSSTGHGTAFRLETPCVGVAPGHILGVLRLALASAVARARLGFGEIKKCLLEMEQQRSWIHY